MPDLNPTYIKIDAGTFYYSTTSSTQLDVALLAKGIALHQQQIDESVAFLQGASAQGVTDADTVLTTLATQPLSAVLTSSPSVGTVLGVAI